MFFQNDLIVIGDFSFHEFFHIHFTFLQFQKLVNL